MKNRINLNLDLELMDSAKVVSALVLTKILLCIGVRRRHSATMSLRALIHHKVPNASSAKSPSKTLHFSRDRRAQETDEHIFSEIPEVNHVA